MLPLFLIGALLWYLIGVLTQIPVAVRLNEIYPTLRQPVLSYPGVWWGGVAGPFGLIVMIVILIEWKDE